MDAFVAEGNKPEDFSAKRKQHKKRSDAMDRAFIMDVERLIQEDPSRSMRAIACELNVSATVVRRVVKEEIKLKSYALKRGQFMNQGTKERRLAKAKKLLWKLKKPTEHKQLIFFSDEKNFSQDQKVNRRNNRWICADRSNVPIVMATKFPATVMVLGVVSNQGDVMPPHFFPKGRKINTQEYLTVLKEVVKPWMDEVAAGRPYIFQQDGAPAHNSRETQDWCKKNIPEFWNKELWPPCSPDCNPLDYFVWGFLEKEVNRMPHNNAESLKAEITRSMASLPRDTVVKACRQFRARLQAVVDANGDFIEDK